MNSGNPAASDRKISVQVPAATLPPVHFSPYRPKDLEICLEIFKGNIPGAFLPHEVVDYFDYLTKQAHGSYWTLEMDGQTVGGGGFYVREAGHARLAYGIVRRDWQKKGVGTRLLLFRLNEIAKNEYLKQVSIQTTKPNLGFFTRFGFVGTQVLPDHFGPGLDSHEMLLHLDLSSREKISALARAYGVDA